MSQPTAQLLALADFNDARLDDDEAAAVSASGPESWVELHREPRPDWYVQYWADPDRAAVVADPDSSAYAVVVTPEGMDEADAEVRVTHIARHDPARILREVAFKRLLIANWRELILRIDTEDDPGRRERLAVTRHGLDQVAFQMAAVHDRHPDYQEGWRP